MPLLDPPTNPETASMGSHHLPDDQRPAPVRQARRPRRGFPHLLWALLAGLVVCAVVATVFILRDAADPSHTPAGAPVVASPPASSPLPNGDLSEGSFAGDGRPGDLVTYEVGVDGLQPGTYTTAGALDPARSCHYERRQPRGEGDLSKPVRTRDSIGQETVTLETGDLFKTRNCRPWTLSSEDE